MSRTTSRRQASVKFSCETLHVSRQAYYAARKRPSPTPRRGPAPLGDFTPNEVRFKLAPRQEVAA